MGPTLFVRCCLGPEGLPLPRKVLLSSLSSIHHEYQHSVILSFFSCLSVPPSSLELLMLEWMLLLWQPVIELMMLLLLEY